MTLVLAVLSPTGSADHLVDVKAIVGKHAVTLLKLVMAGTLTPASPSEDALFSAADQDTKINSKAAQLPCLLFVPLWQHGSLDAAQGRTASSQRPAKVDLTTATALAGWLPARSTVADSTYVRAMPLRDVHSKPSQLG
jgi:hypothetical protein